jgi:hypothetical protein
MVKQIRSGSSSSNGHALGGGAKQRGRCSTGSARWVDSVACEEGHQALKASWFGVRYVVGVVVVDVCWI